MVRSRNNICLRWRFTGTMWTTARTKNLCTRKSATTSTSFSISSLNSSANRTVLTGALVHPSSRPAGFLKKVIIPCPNSLSLHGLLRSKKQVPAWTGLTVQSLSPSQLWNHFRPQPIPTQQAPLLLSNSSSTNLAGLCLTKPLPICSQRDTTQVLLESISPGLQSDKPQSLFSQVSVSLKFWLTTQKRWNWKEYTRISINYMRSVLFCIPQKGLGLKKHTKYFN